MKIELLHITECPSWSAALKNLKHSLIDLDLDVPVQVTRINSQNFDEFVQFHGSPTILLDGQDIFPVHDFEGALLCRVYETPEGLRGLPTQQQITQQLTTHMKRDRA